MRERDGRKVERQKTGNLVEGIEGQGERDGR